MVAGAVVCAQQYAVHWFTLDGGGGISAGGPYAVTGTIGQADAGAPLAGGPYSLVGGFWGVSVVQTPGAPRLTVARAGSGQVTIWWPADPGWVLEQSPDLSVGSWTIVPGASSPYTVPVDKVRAFYRLKKP